MFKNSSGKKFRGKTNLTTVGKTLAERVQVNTNRNNEPVRRRYKCPVCQQKFWTVKVKPTCLCGCVNVRVIK